MCAFFWFLQHLYITMHGSKNVQCILALALSVANKNT